MIERLGAIATVLLDKTGTLTLGNPRWSGSCRSTGSIQRSCFGSRRPSTSSPRMRSRRRWSTMRNGRASTSSCRKSVEERLGTGIEGTVNGDRVAVGSASWLQERGYGRSLHGARAASTTVRAPVARRCSSASTEQSAAESCMGDHLREDAAGARRIAAGGRDRHVAIVTGDRAEVADDIAAQLGVEGSMRSTRPRRSSTSYGRCSAHPSYGPCSWWATASTTRRRSR